MGYLLEFALLFGSTKMCNVDLDQEMLEKLPMECYLAWGVIHIQ